MSKAPNQGHTNREISGVLYLQSATAGVNSRFEGRFCAAVATFCVLRYGSCAITPCEPCQVGNQAALSNVRDVIQGSLC